MNEIITSTKNEYVKQLRSLKQPKYRKIYGKFLAEGDKCAKEALDYADVEAILLLDERIRHDFAQEAARKKIRVAVVSRAVMEALSEVKTPQAAVAVVRRKAPPPFLPQGVIAALEDVSDPTNVGAIIRTADAVGAAGVLLSAGCADYTAPRAVRASMGSLFHVPIHIAGDFYEQLACLKQQGWRMVGAHLNGQNRLQQAAKSCLLIGNEARGLSKQAALICDDLLKIAMYGNAESLNASVAAGILLYRLKEGF